MALCFKPRSWLVFKKVIMASPPKPGSGIPPAILYAAYLAGSDYALNLGGVQAIASMRLGFFTGHWCRTAPVSCCAPPSCTCMRMYAVCAVCAVHHTRA